MLERPASAVSERSLATGGGQVVNFLTSGWGGVWLEGRSPRITIKHSSGYGHQLMSQTAWTLIRLHLFLCDWANYLTSLCLDILICKVELLGISIYHIGLLWGLKELIRIKHRIVPIL